MFSSNMYRITCSSKHQSVVITCSLDSNYQRGSDLRKSRDSPSERLSCNYVNTKSLVEPYRNSTVIKPTCLFFTILTCSKRNHAYFKAVFKIAILYFIAPPRPVNIEACLLELW